MDLSRLKSNLLNTGLQVKDNPLFQVIDQLIRTIEGLNKEVNSVLMSGSSAVINQNLMNGLTVPLFNSNPSDGLEYFDNPYPALNTGLAQPIVNNIIQSLTLPIETIFDREYGDDPYPVLNGGIVQNIVNNVNNINNIVQPLTLPIEIVMDGAYTDDPYPSLGTSQPSESINSIIRNDTTTVADMNIVWVTGSSGALPLFVSSGGLIFRPSTNTISTGSLFLTGAAIITNPSSIGTGFSAQAALDVKGVSATQYALKVFSDNAVDSFGVLINAGLDSGDYSLRIKNRADTLDYFVVRGDGRVGIGTIAPAENLTITAPTSATNQLGFGVTGEGKSFFFRTDAAGFNFYGAGGVGANVPIHFLTGSGAADERLTILGTGNIGIGTTSPDVKLEVEATVTGTTFSNGRVGSFKNLTGASKYTTLYFTDALTSDGYVGFYSGTSQATARAFISVSGAEDLVVLGTGLVGIGTTSPSNKFVVSNAGAAGIEFDPTSGSIFAYNRSTLAYVPLSFTGSTFTFGISGGSALFIDTGSNIAINATKKLYLDGTAATGDTYILETSANVLDMFAGAVKQLSIFATGATFNNGINVNSAGTVTSGFGNGVNIGTWDALGYVTGGVRIALGGYRASQWTSIGLYTDGVERVLINSTGISTPLAITSSGGGVGYSTGAGGTVTQITSRTTTVVLNKLCGNITMFSAAQASQALVTFTLTNSFIAATDYLDVQHISATNGGAWVISTVCAAGSATINIRNVTAASITEATPLRFSVIKGVTS